MEAIKLEEIEVIETQESNELPQKKNEKNLLLVGLLSWFFPVFGWGYSKGLKGVGICLAVYIPLACLIIIPILGWAAIFIGHVGMTYLNYSKTKEYNESL